MRTFILTLVLLTSAQLAFAQGNIGAPMLQRQFEKAYRDTLRAKDEKNVDGLVTKYRSTGEPESVMPEAWNEAGLLGEANVAALGTSAVKPAVMVRGVFQKRDYLAAMAQLLFGDTSADPTRDESSSNLFVPEASRYALNVLGLWRPRSKNSVAKEFAVNFGFYYALKQLPPDSMQTDLKDTGVIHGHLGMEYIVFQRALSIYVNGHVLSCQKGVDNFRSYFGTEVKQTFGYWAPGLRIKFSDSIFVDCEMIVITNEMKQLWGNDDGVLPIFRLGFSQSVFGLD